ncbi:MAG: DUF2806 domain-containing protein [Clostridia bacterium]|nr:DUF2806 domain-containing protein [Clostridia bacterium]
MENLPGLIVSTIQTAVEAVPNTVNGIAKIKEIQRSTGITKRQSKNLLRESETNEEIVLAFQKFCEANPGYYYKQVIGNIEMSNLGKILEYAKSEFKQDENIPDTKLDNEWLLKFLDTAGQVSDEEKQRILAKVLAGQLKKPDSISYRTLSILKTLTTKELVLFKKAVSCCFYMPNAFALLLKNRNHAMLSVAEIMYLDECNLLDGTEKTLIVNGKLNLLSCNNKYVLNMSPENENKEDVDCYYLSNAAFELLPLVNAEEVQIDDMKGFILKCKVSNISFSLHKTLFEGADGLHYSDENLLI